MPLRHGGCFVDRMSERDRVRDLRHGRGEVEIGGGIEDRIAAQNDEGLDRALLHRGDERGERADARKGRVRRLVVDDRPAGVAEIRVQGADRGVDGRGLALPSHDHPPAAVRQKVLGKGVDPARVDTGDAGSRQARGSCLGRSKACSERCEEGSDLPALEAKPMIRHGSRQGVHPFDGVQAVHRPASGSRAPSGREAARVTDHLGVGQERVGVEGEDDGRLIEPEHEVEVAPRCGPQTREPVLVADRLVGRPDCPRIAGAELGCEARQRGGGEGLGEDRQASAAIRGVSLGQLLPGRHEFVPGPRLPIQSDRLRAVGIVQAEHGRLDARARGPEGGGMAGVPLDLGRSPLVALDNETVGAPAERHRRGVVAGDPRDDLLGGVDKGNNLFDGAPASRKPRERQRGAQEHHHLAPGDPLGDLRGSLREFPLEERARLGAILALRETSPIRPCHRWHPEQSVGGLTGRSRSSCAASVWTSRGGVHLMLVTSETGRLWGPGLR